MKNIKTKIWTFLGTAIMLLPFVLGLGTAEVSAAVSPTPENVTVNLHKLKFTSGRERRVICMEVKKRFKMYKKGKTWVIAPILFIGVASFTVNNEVAKASEQPVTNATVAESTDGNNTVVDNGSSNTSIAEEAPNISEDKLAITPVGTENTNGNSVSTNENIAASSLASEQPVTNATVAESTDGNNTVVDNGSSNTSIAEEAPNISEDKLAITPVGTENTNGNSVSTNENIAASSLASEQPVTNATVTENTNETSAVLDNENNKEWVSVSQVPGTVVVNEVEGIRYNTLSSTLENDNGNKMALFEKDGLHVDDAGNATVSLSFVEQSKTGEGRFGVLLKQSDNQNYIMVGYDRAGWFWEYKSAVDSAWMTTKRSVKAPTKGSKNELMISLKHDGQLNASVNGENLFDTYNVLNLQ
ncbi:hypothetical protein EfmAA290_17730 [Enterococcus faecium]|nr:hypothetical protein EfmAA290_17730 [Enterococcus faecium]